MQHRSRATVAALLVAVVLTGVLEGCGGGDEPERLSRAALVDRVESVCAEGKREADRLRAQAEPGRRGEGAAAEVDATLEALNTQIDAFADLRGPASTDAPLARLVDQLRIAADGVEELREAVLDDDLTVDEALQQNPAVVERVNLASAEAADLLVDLGFLSCVGVAG